MDLVVCLDNKLGMSLNARRLSSDVEVTKDIVNFAAGRGIVVHPNSARLFNSIDENTVCVESFLDKLNADDVFFVEFVDPFPLCFYADKIVVYRWNRTYPSDVRFTYPLPGDNFVLTETKEFAGRSHELITREVYTRKGVENFEHI